jgi:hypothetical protein
MNDNTTPPQPHEQLLVGWMRVEQYQQRPMVTTMANGTHPMPASNRL